MWKYNLNENYFENINDERKAYWLGFISADGNITSTNKFTKSLRLRVNLHEKDSQILEEFKKDLNSESPLRYFVSNKGNKYESLEVKIEINSNKLCDDLISLGII